jgi:hypothetical protein
VGIFDGKIDPASGPHFMRSLCTISKEDRNKITAYKIKHGKLPKPSVKSSLVQQPGAPDSKEFDEEEEDESYVHNKIKQQEKKKQEAGFENEVEKLHSL